MFGKKIFLIGLAVCFVVPIIWGMPTKVQGKFIEERLAEVEIRVAKLEEELTAKIANLERAIDILEKRLKALEEGKVAISEISLPTYLLLHFDERAGSVAHDSTPYGHHGAIHGAAWTDGIRGSALYFDGKDDLVDLDDTSQWRPLDKFTWELWIKPSQTLDGTMILGTGGKAGDPPYNTEIYISKNKIYYSYERGRTNYTVNSQTELSIGDWYHIVVLHNDSQGNVSLFLNGILEDSSTCAGPTVQNDAFYLGKRLAFGTAHYFNGVIDEVAIYSKTLSPEEIKEHYEAKKVELIE